eukprot:scaffold1190_cov187-Ochromonas_danica.AAC.17
MAAATSGNEVDDTIRELKKITGFTSYLVLNNDGIVIKYENMSYRVAVHHAHLILSLCSKASKYIRDLLETPDVSTYHYHLLVTTSSSFSHYLCYAMLCYATLCYVMVSSQNEVESIRLITKEYEMIVAQHGNFTLVVTHSNSKAHVKVVVEGEKKEGEVVEQKKEVVAA